MSTLTALVTLLKPIRLWPSQRVERASEDVSVQALMNLNLLRPAHARTDAQYRAHPLDVIKLNPLKFVIVLTHSMHHRIHTR